MIAENDLARRGRNRLADDELLVFGRPPARRQQPHQVAVPVLKTENEVLAAGLERLLQHFGIGCRKVGWRQHVQHLPNRELDHSLIRWRRPVYAGGCVVPPLLSQEEGLRQQIERRTFPLWIGETPILWLRLDQ